MAVPSLKQLIKKAAVKFSNFKGNRDYFFTPANKLKAI